MAFLLGRVYKIITVNEVALMLGLPNKGLKFNFNKTPLAMYEQKDLAAEMLRLSEAEWIEELEGQRVEALVRFVLCKLFFPLKVMKIPKCLHTFSGLEDFKKYNWPEAIHSFLQLQFRQLSIAATKNKSKESLGYIEGCSILLLVRNKINLTSYFIF
ncbi:hypothetical protein KSP40_PGU012775 [Platanthera guangdongensis]|uniref:Uncharacterized protein n=1 Tax=Platanthera guangdongensis TaxID=2320717 RepID=A0ABR2N2F2_9ASPA